MADRPAQATNGGNRRLDSAAAPDEVFARPVSKGAGDQCSAGEAIMAAVDGTYETVVKSPLGDQKSTLVVNSNGNSWTGTNSGAMGSVDITDGTVDGNTIKWTMQMTVPMPMTLTCEATVDGDAITGSIGAGAFGSFPMSGTRVG